MLKLPIYFEMRILQNIHALVFGNWFSSFTELIFQWKNWFGFFFKYLHIQNHYLHSKIDRKSRCAVISSQYMKCKLNLMLNFWWRIFLYLFSTNFSAICRIFLKICCLFRFRLLAQKRVISMNLGLFIELISYYFKIIREKVQYKHQEFKEQKVRNKKISWFSFDFWKGSL